MSFTGHLVLWVGVLNMFFTIPHVSATGASIVFPSPRFNDWFPFYYGEMMVAADQCQTTINTYYHANESARPLPGQNSTPCALVQNCLLSTLDEEVKANMASSSVILGLTPTILSFIGPKVGDIVPLLIERPLLGSLISFGSPAISTVQLFSDFEFKTREKRPWVAAFHRRFVLYQQKREARTVKAWMVCISVIEYVLIAGALVNQIDTTLKLGRRVVISWHCTFSVIGQLLLLITIGLSGQWLAASSVILRTRRSFENKFPSPPPQLANGDQMLGRRRNSDIAKSIWHWTRAKLDRLSGQLCWLASKEFVPQFFRFDSIYQREFHAPTLLSDFLYFFASAAPLALYLYGTLVFSSFLFISTNDAALVTFRYIATTLICRLVLFFELESMP